MTKSGRRAPRAADKYDLYQRSVQEPEADVDFIREAFMSEFDREPRLLREDFCGTAYLATEWVGTHPDNRAWGIDLDPEPLAWGRRHNLARLAPKQRRRLRLVRGNVLDRQQQQVDVVAAFNFSFFTFQTREALIEYFAAAYDNLKREGLFVLDLYGGPEAQERVEETTEYDGFDYIWDQDFFDAINNRMTCFIHFETDAGERLERAFSYDWRLWTLPELREALLDAGFGETVAYWEGTDDDTGEGNGIFTRESEAENTESWIAYVVAIKR